MIVSSIETDQKQIENDKWSIFRLVIILWVYKLKRRD